MASEKVQQLITLFYCYKTLEKFNKCSMDDDGAFKRIVYYHKQILH